MSETTSLKKIPHLSFFSAQSSIPGVQVHEIDFASSVSPMPLFRASRFTVDPNCSSSAESHFVHEIWVIIQGKGKLRYDNQEMEINQDNFVYFEPYKTHQLINNGTEMIVVLSIYWK